MALSASKSQPSKQARKRYSQLICLACRERRIRCELPDDIEIPTAGELRPVQTPCYRCAKRGIPCIVRQTILGRPGAQASGQSSTIVVPAACQPTPANGVVAHIVIDLELSRSPGSHSQPASRASGGTVVVAESGQCCRRGETNMLLLHKPQSSESVLIIRAVDMLRRERVEHEWFRYLPAYVGHTRAIDLSIKALVAACAYGQGVANVSSSDCYQALALAIEAIQTNMTKSRGTPGDDIVASIALLAPFDGVVKKSGVQTRLHVEGLAAMIAARPKSYPVTQLAREIIDFNACEAAVMACIGGVPSPFESVPRQYFANDRSGSTDSDRAKLKALGNELSTLIPRLVTMVRTLRSGTYPQIRLLSDAVTLSESLSELQIPEAEQSLLQTIQVQPDRQLDAEMSIVEQWQFTNVEDFEALLYYWQSRLSLLRLVWRLQVMIIDHASGISNATKRSTSSLSKETAEASRLVMNILRCTAYAGSLPLRKQNRLFAHAMVVVWGILMDLPLNLGEDQRVDASSVTDLLLVKVNDALSAKPGLTAGDMDLAAEIFVGGQSMGRFAELFGL